ncbi:SDR family NAD(P)-dependent oxidoreductase [Jatrophihabitans sp. DSM 45814]
MELQGKVALVTGASRGVGAAVAVALGEAGCAVACAARSTADQPQRTPGTLDRTLELVRAAGGDAIAIPTNLAKEDEVVAMVRRAEEVYGRVDILINNAAITFVGDLDIPLHRHDLIMEVNLRAPLIATRTVMPGMRARRIGSIVNVSSVAALYPHPSLMSYGISKVGLERLTIDVAKQVQEYGIAVNCFRIDIPVASEGFVANTPGTDRANWEPSSVAAEGILWMLQQPASYSGRRESMFGLRQREGIMRSQAQHPYTDAPPTELFSGLAEFASSNFVEPYPDSAATGEVQS